MKAVRALDGGVTVVDVDEPPGVGELVSVKAASICSSDFLYISLSSGKVLGHELAVVREDGTPAVVEAIYGCMECDECRAGRYNLCPTHGQRALGISADGGMVEQFRAPTARLVPLPAALDPRDASLVEPASVSWHALRLAGTGPDTPRGGGRRRRARAPGRGRRPEDGGRRRRRRGPPPPSTDGRRAPRGPRRHRWPLRRRGRSGGQRGWHRPRRRARRAGRHRRRAGRAHHADHRAAVDDVVQPRGPGRARRSGTAPTTAVGRWRTRRPCWPTTRTSPGR